MQFKIPLPSDPYPSRAKQLPQSTIKQRGWREYRKPKEFINTPAQTVDNGPVSPVLNEMLSNELNILSVEQRRLFNDKDHVKEQNQKLIKIMNTKERQEILNFYDNIISPPANLPIPEDPQIQTVSPFSIHREITPIPISSSAFVVKEMDSMQIPRQDEDPFDIFAS